MLNFCYHCLSECRRTHRMNRRILKMLQTRKMRVVSRGNIDPKIAQHDEIQRYIEYKKNSLAAIKEWCNTIRREKLK